jgi:hypothetical protein
MPPTWLSGMASCTISSATALTCACCASAEPNWERCVSPAALGLPVVPEV